MKLLPAVIATVALRVCMRVGRRQRLSVHASAATHHHDLSTRPVGCRAQTRTVADIFKDACRRGSAPAAAEPGAARAGDAATVPAAMPARVLGAAAPLDVLGAPSVFCVEPPPPPPAFSAASFWYASSQSAMYLSFSRCDAAARWRGGPRAPAPAPVGTRAIGTRTCSGAACKGASACACTCACVRVGGLEHCP
eukprot:354015-Chlamydomonas_euryale.AAC.1